MGVDWKKEIKLSDLVRSRGKKAKPADPAEIADPAPAKTSVLKKEIRLFKRKPKAPKEAVAPAAPAAKQSVLKKEIRLFKRKPKAKPSVEPAEAFDAVAPPPAPEPAATAIEAVETSPLTEAVETSAATEAETPASGSPFDSWLAGQLGGAAEAHLYEEVAPEAPAAEPEPPEQSVLKKEIRLFKRKPKEPKEAAAAGDGTSVLKKEIKLGALLARRPKGPKEPRAKRGKGAEATPAVPIMRAFNLLPRDLERGQKEKRHPVTHVVVVAVGLVALAGLAAGFLVSSADVSDKTKTRDELSAQLQEALRRQAELAAGEERTDPALLEEESARTSALSTALGSRIAWDRFLRDLSLVLPEDVWLQGVIAQPLAPVTNPETGALAPLAGSALTINGMTRAQDGVARLLSRLEVLPQLTGVNLLSSAVQTVGGEEVVVFSVTATVKQPGAAAA
jgi:Tfp pilus assembly protein PilN